MGGTLAKPDKQLRSVAFLRRLRIELASVPGAFRYIDHDGDKRATFLLPDGCAIGRRPSKHLICLSDDSVSSGHAWIEFRDDGWWVSDLGSATGTFVNDRRIMSSALRSGDILRCGNFPLRFEATPPAKGALLAGLVFVSIDGQRQTVMIHPEGGALGTFSGATVIGEHDSIARIHAFVYYDGEQWMIVPVARGYETKINGHTISASGTRLRAGDAIQCGALQVRFVLLRDKLPALSSDQRRAQPNNCPPESSPLSVRSASPLTAGVSSMLAAPSGFSVTPRARLSYRDDKQLPIVVEVPASGGFLGRALECLVRSGDLTVPRKWGRIFFRDNRWLFEDLGSSSPSFVNDEQQFPHVPRELRSGDTLRNRSMVLVFSSDGLLAQGSTIGFVKVDPPPPPPVSGSYFLLLSDDGESKQIPIPDTGAVLGRSRGCLLMTEDPLTSRQHARIIWEQDIAWIEDLSKDQGTWHGGERLLGERRRLHTGDLIRAGQIRARFVGKDASFPQLDERFRPFRIRCPIGNIGPLRLYWADHPELSATVILRVLPADAPDHARWLSTLVAESRLLRIHAASSPLGGTLLREKPDDERFLSVPLGCGLLLSEFLSTYGPPPLPLLLELLGQLCADIEQRSQRDPTRQDGQLPLREVWLYADPIAPLGMATRLLPLAGTTGQRPSPVLQAPESSLTPPNVQRHSQVYVYGLLLYALASGSLPSHATSQDKLLGDLRSQLPPVLFDLLHELLHVPADKRPDPYHAQRWIAELRSLLCVHGVTEGNAATIC